MTTVTANETPVAVAVTANTTPAATPVVDEVDFFNEYATDETAEHNGAEVPIKGRTFLIARANNRAYGKLLTKEYNKHQRVLDAKDAVADAKSDEIMIDVIARTILKGWIGIINFKGEKLAYSLDNAKKLLALKDFRTDIMRAAEDREVYRLIKNQEQEKN